MKKYSCFILCCLLAGTLGAQIFITSCGSTGAMGNKDWKMFAAAYERANQGNLEKTKMRFGMATGYSWGLDVLLGEETDFLNHSYIGFRRTMLTSRATATTASGTREFQLQDRSWYCPVGAGIRDEKFMAAFTLGVGISKAELLTSFRYLDGTQSISRDKFLNGVYSGTSFILIPQIQYGFGMETGSDALSPKIFVFADLGYRFAMGADSFDDKLYVDGNYIDFTDDEEYSMLPKNYDKFLADPAAYDFYSRENTVRAAFRGIHFNIGIRFGIL